MKIINEGYGMKVSQRVILVLLVVSGYASIMQACLCRVQKKRGVPEVWGGDVSKLVQKQVASPHRAQLLDRDITLSGDVDTVNERGYTRSIIAASFGDDELITMLLNRGASIDAETYDGSTALMEASEHGHSVIVKKLLARGARVNKKDIYGNTALTKAALSGHIKIVQWLICAGAENSSTLLANNQIARDMRQGVIVATKVRESIEDRNWLSEKCLQQGVLRICRFPAVIEKVVREFCVPYVQNVECKDLAWQVLVDRDLQRAKAVTAEQDTSVESKRMEGIGVVIAEDREAPAIQH